MTTLLMLASIVLGQSEAPVQVLAEIGRETRNTRLYSVCSANLEAAGCRRIQR
jgi:hypothetical protein